MRKTLLILGIFLIFIFYTPASSQEDVSFSQFKKASDAVGYKILAVSPIKFKPISSNQYQTFEWEWNEIGITVPSGNPENLTLVAQFDLPDGAEIKRVAAIYYDNSVLADIHIGIGAIKPFDLSEPEFMVYFTSEGLANVDALRTFDTTTIINPIINNKNIYFAMVEFDNDTMGDVAFRGLWIAYE
jgi:hypothetical protein